MTHDLDPAVAHGQEEPSEDRETQNHGAVKNSISGPEPVPSAPPSCFARCALQDGSRCAKQDALL